MNTDECYNRWLASRRALDIPEEWTDSVMQRIDRYEASRHRFGKRMQAWMEWLCNCMPARAVLVLAGSFVCVTRFVVLFLAILG